MNNQGLPSRMKFCLIIVKNKVGLVLLSSTLDFERTNPRAHA